MAFSLFITLTCFIISVSHTKLIICFNLGKIIKSTYNLRRTVKNIMSLLIFFIMQPFCVLDENVNSHSFYTP